MMERVCDRCGVDLPRDNVKYCSRACYDEVERGFRPVESTTRIPITCGHCGGVFFVKPSHTRRRHCSRKCADGAKRGRPTAKRHGRTTIVCAICETLFSVKPSQATRRKFCSRGCSDKGRAYNPPNKWIPRKQHACLHCGEVFEAQHFRSPKYCSQKCQLLAKRGKWPVERTTQVPYVCLECGETWYAAPSRAKHGGKYCSMRCHGIAKAKRMAETSPTSIEIALYGALTELGITFERQHAIRWYVVDAFIPATNTIVEANGDYWHTNPEVYPDGPKDEIQRRRFAVDQRRRTYFANRGYRLVELWEKDIHELGAKALLERALLEDGA